MRILIVEDESKIANSLKKGLEQEGFAVDTAFDGLSGYDLALTEPYDAIILDLMLPKMDGMELCSRIREEDVTTPVLMLTAKDTLNDKVQGLNTGADDYLTKPFAFEELLARTRALLRRPSDSTTDILKTADLIVDVQNHLVKREEDEISLSKKEFALLEYLLRNKGRVVTKNQIIQHVWNFDADILPNTVEVYIGYLRDKLEKQFPEKPKLIKTVRGFGYKLKDLEN